jgi:WD40 repeat protein
MRIPLALAFATLIAGTVPGQGPGRTDLYGDPLPARALLRLGSVRFRSDVPINSLAFSPDGRLLLASGYSNQVIFWDRGTGKEVKRWTVKTSGMSALQFTADGRTLALAGNDGAVRLLDGVTGTERRVLQGTPRHGNLTIALAPDGKAVLTAHSYGREFTLWNAEKGTATARFKVNQATNAPPFAFTGDGKQFVGLATDNKLHVYDAASGKQLRALEGSAAAQGRILFVAVSPDSRQVVCGLSDRTLTVLDFASGRVVRRLERVTANYSTNRPIFFTPNGRFVVEGSNYNSLRVWGLASGTLMREFVVASGGYNQLALSRDGKTAAACSGNVVYLWDVASGGLLHTPAGHQSPIGHLAFTPDGTKVVSMGSSSMRVWDAGSGKELELIRGPSMMYGHNNFQMLPDSKGLRYLGIDRAVYELRFGAKEARRLTSPVTTPSFSSSVVSPDGKVMAAVNSDRKLRLVSLHKAEKDRELATLDGYYANAMTFAPDGRRLAVCLSSKALLLLFDVASGVELRRIQPDRPGPLFHDAANPVTFAHDGRTFLHYRDNGVAGVETVTGAVRFRLPNDVGVAHLAWSPDGRLVGRTIIDGTVVVLDTYTGREVMRRATGQGVVQALAFSRDNRRLVTGGANTTGLVWEVPALAKPPAKTLDAAWRDLKDGVGTKAHEAMALLASHPEQAVKLFRKRLKPPRPIDPKRLAKLLADLDSDEFDTREAASDALLALGLAAEDALLRAAKSESAEVRRRVAGLLRRLKRDGIAPERLRVLRAVEVLERLNTPAARELLEGLGKLPLDTLLREELAQTRARLGIGG